MDDEICETIETVDIIEKASPEKNNLDYKNRIESGPIKIKKMIELKRKVE